ncbi:MAG: KH domain-containing protein [Acidobacteriota bacterium]|nr:KH domain-containing protein [Acidobacteriota bacterium]
MVKIRLRRMGSRHRPFYRVVVSEIEEEDAIVLQVEVAPEELGRVIGRQGRSVRSLRALLEVRGAEAGEYYEVEIVEPE